MVGSVQVRSVHGEGVHGEEGTGEVWMVRSGDGGECAGEECA